MRGFFPSLLRKFFATRVSHHKRILLSQRNFLVQPNFGHSKGGAAPNFPCFIFISSSTFLPPSPPWRAQRAYPRDFLAGQSQDPGFLLTGGVFVAEFRGYGQAPAAQSHPDLPANSLLALQAALPAGCESWEQHSLGKNPGKSSVHVKNTVEASHFLKNCC